jgi:uncharacterized protein YqcC (DUF446 family)
MNLFVEAASLLIDIEAELRRMGLWEQEAPSAAALASTEPFCVDTLSLPQWLQFVFLPRMYALLEVERLPAGRCEVRPLAEQYFTEGGLPATALIATIGRLDELLNSQLLNN